MTDNIWNDNGKHLAWITATGDVFSVSTKQKIATLRGSQMYALDGTLLPSHLETVGLVRAEGATTPKEFLDLLQ